MRATLIDACGGIELRVPGSNLPISEWKALPNHEVGMVKFQVNNDHTAVIVKVPQGTGEESTDTLHDSSAEAMKQAEREFGVQFRESQNTHTSNLPMVAVTCLKLVSHHANDTGGLSNPQQQSA